MAFPLGLAVGTPGLSQLIGQLATAKRNNQLQIQTDNAQLAAVNVSGLAESKATHKDLTFIKKLRISSRYWIPCWSLRLCLVQFMRSLGDY